jgi:proteasome accessory factor B
VFRLSRIAGDPKAVGAKHAVTRPPAVELTALVAAYDAASPASLALVRVRVGRCLGLRRLAVNTSEGPPGWDVIELTYPAPERLADQVLPYGADAVVTDPPDAVEAVVRRLRALSEQSA